MPSKIDGAQELQQDRANHGTRLRVGLFAIGLDAYWNQFPGLQEQLTGHAERVAQLLERPGVEVVNLGMIDSPEKALAAGHAFRRADVDLLFLHVATYSLSSTVLPIVRRVGVPVIVLSTFPQEPLSTTPGSMPWPIGVG